jgi:hypothetical protein
MGIYLEKYSVLKSPKQGYQIHKLTAHNFNWLAEDPDRRQTARRYNALIKSIRTVAKIALSDSVDAFIIRERKHTVAIGLASIIFDQSVVHPEEGIVRGNNLDYWVTRLSSTNQISKSVAEELVDANMYLTQESFPTKDHVGTDTEEIVKNYPSLFVAVQDDSKISPAGFTNADELHVSEYLRLKPLGEPAKLSVSEGQDDIHGIAAVGRTTQLYYRKASSSLTGSW